ncbi:MAG TPA: Gfo/Idh/MocA family oxidoreductase [Polyangia bacterium]|nr:Gfo/Idh/MocA family oxidoreductase [Polyangia bacterium]
MTAAKQIIRWGIIGCGDVTEVKSGPGFQRAARSALVAVMRRDRARAEDYARRHHVPRFYDDAAALIADPEVDAVYVATPPSSHHDHVLGVARAGKPVYVEKPMALNHAQCQAMIDACAAAGVPLFVAYYRRALPRFLKVKELIDSGRIGVIRLVTVALWQPARADDQRGNPPWRVVPAIAGGGLFVDLGCHTLDLLDFLLGPMARAAGHPDNQAGLYDAEDVVAAHFVFQSGVHGVGIWGFAAGESVDRVEIVGSRGTITFATFGDDPLTVISDGERATLEIPHPPHIQQPMIQTVVDALTIGGVSPSTGESGARTSWVMDQILASPR